MVIHLLLSLWVWIEYAGVSFVDTFRNGLYPTQPPATVGSEVTGVIVALLIDPAGLSHPEYKPGYYAIGANAVAVRI